MQISQRMGDLGVQCRVWAFSGSVLRILTDDDGGALSARFRQHGASHRSFLHREHGKRGNYTVLRYIRAVEYRIVNDRAERDPSDNQQVG